MKISDFKNIHSKKRCFVIGNGPSLSDMDLSKLKKEITFGGNEIYRKENFNLTYLMIGIITDMDLDKLCGFECDYKFFTKRLYPFKKLENVVLVKVINRMSYPFFPNFSLDAEKCIYSGGTVSHLNLQLAYYMGCNPIYLIGVDWWNSNDFGSTIDKHFYGRGDAVNRFTVFDEKIKLFKQNINMRVGDKILRKSGIRVYNLTPNSKLEAFEKKDIEEILCKEVKSNEEKK